MKGLSSFHGGHSFHGDGEGQVPEIARAAAQKGFAAFGFSEHFDRPPSTKFLLPGETDFLTGRGAWAAPYVEAVRKVQVEFADLLPIRLGTELEYIRGAEQWTKNAVTDWPFEYLVGSVHYMRYGAHDICIDCNRGRLEEALDRAGNPEQLQLDYYDHVLELIEWNLVQIVGHLDLVKIYLRPSEVTPTKAIEKKVATLLDSMRDSGVALDVNAAGLRKPFREIYPAAWILEKAAQVGVPVTLGDDSHAPDQVGLGLDAAVALIVKCGYESISVVDENGKLTPGPIPG